MSITKDENEAMQKQEQKMDKLDPNYILAHTSEITHIPNGRQYKNDMAELEAETGTALLRCVFSLDMANLKILNEEKLGGVGHEVLKEAKARGMGIFALKSMARCRLEPHDSGSERAAATTSERGLVGSLRTTRRLRCDSSGRTSSTQSCSR